MSSTIMLYIYDKSERIYQTMLASYAFKMFVQAALLITSMLGMFGGVFIGQLVQYHYPNASSFWFCAIVSYI